MNQQKPINHWPPLSEVARLFAKQGGTFRIPTEDLKSKLQSISGFILDWDGVFHEGHKSPGGHSAFSEADSMGLNMLRYGYWWKFNRLPFIAIITGENNETAIKLAKREHFNAVYTGVTNKRLALDDVCQTANIKAANVLCVFDDINDLPMARHCGVNFQVRRNAGPLFACYLKHNKLTHYLTANSGGQHAVRECCELILGMWGVFHHVVQSRTAFDDTYREYWQKRNQAETQFFTFQEDRKIPCEY